MKYILPICLMFFLVISCGPTTKVTDSWSNADGVKRPLEKVMIIAIMPDKERKLREQIEQQLAANLAAEGFNTTSAYAEYGPKAFDNLKEAQALKKIRGNIIDGVLIVSLLDKEQEKSYTPGRVSYYPVATRLNRFWGYYTTYYSRVYSPAYYTTTTNYFIESNLYDVKSNNLIYSAQSQTFDPSSASNLAEDYAKAIVINMKEKQLLLKIKK